jgi:DNA sulfur modification protein DndC
MASQSDPILDAIGKTREALELRPNARWVLAFSGGKDSTAALMILLAAYRSLTRKSTNITVIYCDTGVENIILDRYVKRTLNSLKSEFCEADIPIEIKILSAPPCDRFFVRIVGRGYPPPTNSFRWCTKNLRINPVSDYLSRCDDRETAVILGLRKNESQQRDRTIPTSGNPHWQRQKESAREIDCFLPIIYLNIQEVWDTIFLLQNPKAISVKQLEELYRGASGECPVIKAPQSPPCASGRFGCWTCTVVRKDKSARELIRSGHQELAPFLQFRDWIAEFRNDPKNRWAGQRNGNAGLGPFSINARKEILRKIECLEDCTGTTILNKEEREIIDYLWTLDHIPRLDFRKLRSQLYQ